MEMRVRMVDVLVQQVRQLLAQPHAEVVQVGEPVIDLPAVRVTLAGELVDLSLIELRLLIYLARNVGQVVSYDALLTEVQLVFVPLISPDRGAIGFSPAPALP